MSTKPILFSTPMVQAILDGRKTMTRRVMNPQPPTGASFLDLCDAMSINAVDRHGNDYPKDVDGLYATFEYDGWPEFPVFKSRYQPGDILWVRETWSPVHVRQRRYLYKADAENGGEGDGLPIRWRPSIHMPKEAARIFLRVTDVRAERLQDILCGDMQREGCIPKTVTGGQWQQWQHDYWIPLWDSIYAERGNGWDTNPWVWVYSFERVDKPAGWPGGEGEHGH